MGGKKELSGETEVVWKKILVVDRRGLREICIDSVVVNISQADELIRKIESYPSISFGSCR